MSNPNPIPAPPAARIRRLVDDVSAVFIGKEKVVADAVLALVCGGHVLIEDVPGLGKTLLAKALAKALQADFKRIQFTADLLPSDVTGVTMYSPETHQFTFRPGPLFANIVLADEINRATPRTQSSLLEAMEEHSVTIDGTRHALPAPFFVIATQNPVELEGTYPLPFAQMDRFMVRLRIGYLDRDNEIRLLRQQQNHQPLDDIRPSLDCAQLIEIRQAVMQVSLDESLVGYLVDIVNATRATDGLEYGASPRGSLDLQRFSQAAALLDGRDFVLPDDIKRAARLILPHRLITRKGTRAVSLNAADVIDRILESLTVPL